jgi:hypothetical protein
MRDGRRMWTVHSTIKEAVTETLGEVLVAVCRAISSWCVRR